MRQTFDTIVVGAGAMGSATAYHLARDGQHVLLLEQYAIAHTRGSSHGESRIFRYAYENPAYVRLAMQSRSLWQALETEANEQLLRPTGGLDFADDGAYHGAVEAIGEALSGAGCQYDMLDIKTLSRRFPQWQLGNDVLAVYSPDAGVLNATRCVEVMVMRAVVHGVTVRDNEPVRDIFVDQDTAEVVTDAGWYQAPRLVITAGPWSNHVLRHAGLELPLRVSQEQTVYVQPRTSADQFLPERFPLWIHHGEPSVYGFPILGLPGIKLAFHADGLFIDVADYTQTPRPEVTARLHAYVQRYLPAVAGEAFHPTTCLYTMTPDEDFIVDRVPGKPHVVFGAGFSGHGFKFAIGIGRALADLVQWGSTEMEIGHLHVGRFLPADKS